MADENIKQVMQDAILDADSLEQFINGDDTQDVLTRLSAEYPTLQKAIKEMFENGGLPATPFKTRADMQAGGLPDDVYAIVTDDTTLANNGLYFKQSGVWIKSKYDFNSFLNDSYKKYGLARLSASRVDSINYITATKTLELNNYVYVVNGSERYIVPTPDTVSFGSNGLFKILFDTTTLKLSAELHNKATVEGLLHCGFVHISNTGIRTYDLLNYQVNGVDFSKGISQEAQAYVVSSNAVNIDTNNNKVVITNALVRIIHGNSSYLLPSTEIALPESDGVYALMYSPSSKDIALVTSNNAVVETDLRFGRLVKEGSSIYLYGIDRYSINGVPSDAPEEIPFEYQRAARANLMPLKPEDFIVDTAQSTVTITANSTRLMYDRNSVLLPETVIDYSAVSPPNGWAVLSYRFDTKTFVTSSTTQPLAKNCMPFAFVSQRTGQVFGVPWYTLDGEVIDGISNGGGSDKPNVEMTKKEYVVPYGHFSKYWKPEAELPDMLSVAGGVNKDPVALYALYDDLMTSNPDYITSSVIGTDKDGNQIKQYKFTPPVVQTARATGKSNVPKIIAVAGVHGQERTGIFNLYNCMKLICENWRADESLAELRWGAEFVVVPCAVPYSFINSTRKNANGVDIARNFSAGWFLNSDPSSITYGGSSPLSEPEAIAINNVLSDNKDAIAFLSHHNYATSSPAKGSYVWVASATYFTENLAKSLITSITTSARLRYSFIDEGIADWVGYADMKAPAGSEAVQAAEVHGIQGSTFEVNQIIPEQSDRAEYNKEIVTLAAEALINWFILNLRHAPDFYNSLNR